MSVPKAMPGQEPYTAEEWVAAYKMAAFLARISEDELEERAKSTIKDIKKIKAAIEPVTFHEE